VAERQDRRREQTRAKLVAATRATVAAKGPDATTIADIAQAADVGFGTFYTYFDTKEAALAAVMADVVRELDAVLTAAGSPADDPAEVLARNIRQTLAQVEHDPAWAWFVVRLGLASDLMAQALGPHLVRDLQRGIDAGRFNTHDLRTAAIAIGGAVHATMRARLERSVVEAAGEELAAGLLQLVGVPGEEAREIATRPISEAPSRSGAR
jgi:AcrR family transcriptional regulator